MQCEGLNLWVVSPGGVGTNAFVDFVENATNGTLRVRTPTWSEYLVHWPHPVALREAVTQLPCAQGVDGESGGHGALDTDKPRLTRLAAVYVLDDPVLALCCAGFAGFS